MQIAIVGCGFVADFYLGTLPLHPALTLRGVFDRDAERLTRFSRFHSVRAYRSLAELVADPEVQLVVNLTNPRSHFEVSKAALLAGKHVYSEKPLAMDFREARALVELAEAQGLQVSSAPCSFLSETAQTMAQALRDNRIGKVRAVYAEIDDGLVHRMPYRKWMNKSGTPWPYVDEFEVGCTLEHAGYCLTWLAGFFGPAESVTAFASVQIPDKVPDEVPPERMGPDFSVACIRFASGVVARLTCSIIAPHDHRLLIHGDEGLLWTKDTWRYRSPVFIRKFVTVRRRMVLNPVPSKLPMLGTELPLPISSGSAQMDFSRGVAELAAAVVEGRPSRLSARFSLHVNEISLAIHSATHGGGKYEMTTSFDAGPPMPWAHPTRRLQPLQKLAVPQVFASARASRVAHTASATTGWAIVGTGFVARQFVRGLSLVPGARLSAIVDLSISSAQAFAQAYAPSARVYDTLAGALADERVDIVYLATPNHLHAPQCLEALAARKPVLVEKPFATNAAEARHMVETARKQRVFCMEAMWLRYMPLVQRARSLIAQGAIGSIQTMTADFAYPTDLSDPHNRFLDPVVGSGALLDRGVYCLSLAFLLLGQPTEIMSTASLTPFGIDVHSTMLLRFGSGATASLWCSLTADGSNSAAVFGTKGTLRLHPPFYRPYRLTATTSSTPFTNALPEPSPPGFAVRVKEHVLVQRVLRPLQALLPPAIDIHEPVAGTGYQFEAEEAARCLRDGLLESPLMPLDETLRIMETMDAIRGQWRSNALHAQPIEKSAGV